MGSSVTQRLFALAGYRDLSATAFGIFANENTVFENSANNKKMYIPFFINNMRLVGLLDSGSDLCIVALSITEKLGIKNLTSAEIKSITTFSGNSIPILGVVKVLLKLNKDHKGISIHVHVIQDIQNIPKILLGNNLLQEGVATLGYTGRQPPHHIPTVKFTQPEICYPNVFFKTREETFQCKVHVNLGPYEQGHFEVQLDPAAQVLRTDIILVTGNYFSHRWAR